ncbi:uncharacterized protein LOC127838106 isoform X2 [Dreissena polymorpha]|uniref:Uncharacterized protein n=1 Tax=Dreissena polymorpha TaxID=45954 RepID=A0A9D4J0I4_DREPO|nr:uncharacterized protein LOC127838106 isoform X2 [Dreissena polymorpha]KAH3795201.1 hypothetical protein DPMN_148749 [Dreissena polymorpha]
MSEFKTSFTAILNRDLKHIYSGFPRTLTYRHSNPYPTQEQMRMKDESSKLKTYVLKSSEFVPEYSCLIPRAPAFRVLSRHHVDDLVVRLSQPTIASKGISLTSDHDTILRKHESNNKYLGLRSIDEREQTMITERVSRPTQSSRTREFQTRRQMTHI